MLRRSCARTRSARSECCDVLLEARLEVLERGERLPAGVHLDVQVLVGLHVIKRQQVERDGRGLGAGEALPRGLSVKVRVQALNLARGSRRS